jgi:hypothetical protein
LENNVTKYTELNSIKKRAFLAAYSLCGNITRAAELAEVSRGSHYLWMNEDETYQLCFADADQEAIERLEAEARRRAVQGVSKPVFYQGMECGVVQEYSDTLLMFLLKGAKPQKYRDNVAVDANISVTFEQLLKKALEE